MARWTRPALLVLLPAAFLGGTVVGAARFLDRDLPALSQLERTDYTTGLISRVYGSDGSVIHEFYVEKRIPIRLREIPPYLKEATLTVEDQSFYSHGGVDILGILRALAADVLHRRVVQGGSTITQQLARNLFLTPERTLSRKIKEALLALEIERHYTKDEILEFYFNQIYFGSGAYGVESAAQTYFGKHTRELTVEEAATLAGIPRWPARYSPRLHPETALERRNLVLDLMARRGVIREAAAAAAKKKPLTLTRTRSLRGLAPHLVEEIRQELEERFGYNRLYKNGLRIYTTIDPHLQEAAERLLEEGLRRIEEMPGYRHPTYPDYIRSAGGTRKEEEEARTPYLQGALVAIEPSTGYIRALVGGRDFTDSKFDRAVRARRQPGSVFKPFVYTAAIDNGIPVSTIIVDSPIALPQVDGTIWRPTNYEGTFGGPTILRDALRRSVNLIAIKLLMRIGAPTVVAYAHRMGIAGPLPPYESLALGTAEVTPLEVTAAFAIFPNQGERMEPLALLRVEDADGLVLEEHRPRGERALSPQTAYIMTSLLRDVIDRGTGYPARQYGFTRPAGGKTGTMDDFTDAWFIGFTPDLACGVWVGFDEKQTIINHGSGAVIALPIWTEFMKVAHEGLPERTFPVPQEIVTRAICQESGLLAGEHCPREEVYSEVFLPGTEPTVPCDVHTGGLWGQRRERPGTGTIADIERSGSTSPF